MHLASGTTPSYNFASSDCTFLKWSVTNKVRTILITPSIPETGQIASLWQIKTQSDLAMAKLCKGLTNSLDKSKMSQLPSFSTGQYSQIGAQNWMYKRRMSLRRLQKAALPCANPIVPKLCGYVDSACPCFHIEATKLASLLGCVEDFIAYEANAMLKTVFWLLFTHTGSRLPKVDEPLGF